MYPNPDRPGRGLRRKETLRPRTGGTRSCGVSVDQRGAQRRRPMPVLDEEQAFVLEPVPRSSAEEDRFPARPSSAPSIECVAPRDKSFQRIAYP